MIKINRPEQLNFFSRIARWFFTRWKFGLLLFVLIISSGVLAYSSLIRREGFPPVDIPVSVVAGAYFVDDPQAVDQQVIRPLSETVLQVDGVIGISSTANTNSWQVTAELEDGLTNEKGKTG